MTEYFDLVDESGRIIGSAAREQCHGNPSLMHRAVHVLVFDSAGRLYLQRRAESKDVQPGMWDSSVGGHVALGEGFQEAAAREMWEELALGGAALTHLYDYLWHSPMESESIRTYRTVWDGAISPDPDEIAEGRFWSMEEIGGRRASGLFTPSLQDEIRRYRRWEAGEAGASGAAH